MVWNLDRYLTTNIFKDKRYTIGTLYMSNFLNPPLQELDLVQAWFLLFIFVLKIHCAWLLMRLKNCTLVYQWLKVCKVKSFNVSMLSKYDELLIIKHTELNFFNNTFMWNVHDRWLSKWSQKIWLFQQWQEFDQRVLYFMDRSERWKMSNWLWMFHLRLIPTDFFKMI